MMNQEQETEQQETLTTAHHDYAGKLGRHAFFKVHSREESEDLVQDTFMKTWKYLVKGGKIATMKSFLYHILNNLIVDSYRKNKTVSLDAILEKSPEPSDDVHERMVNVMDGQTAFLLMHRLPEKYRKVLRMRYVQHLSLSEIAILTGQSKNTVAVQVHRGLAKLKSLYDRPRNILSPHSASKTAGRSH